MENKISLTVINVHLKGNAFFYCILLFCIMFTSCNNLPADLQNRKDACISKLTELADKEKYASSNDYKQLVQDYSQLKDEVISYTAECNKRGISKENDKLISELTEKISKFESLYKNDNSSNNSISKKTRTVYSGGYAVEINLTPPAGYEQGMTCSDCDGEGVVHDNGIGKTMDMICAGCAGRGFHLRKKRNY